MITGKFERKIPKTINNLKQFLRVKVRVTVDVFSGDMLYSTYTYTMQGTSARQSHLKYGYHFTCRCARCLDPTELGTNISSLKCNKCDSGFILSTDPLSKTPPIR